MPPCPPRLVTSSGMSPRWSCGRSWAWSPCSAASSAGGWCGDECGSPPHRPRIRDDPGGPPGQAPPLSPEHAALLAADGPGVHGDVQGLADGGGDRDGGCGMAWAWQDGRDPRGYGEHLLLASPRHALWLAHLAPPHYRGHLG